MTERVGRNDVPRRSMKELARRRGLEQRVDSTAELVPSDLDGGDFHPSPPRFRLEIVGDNDSAALTASRMHGERGYDEVEVAAVSRFDASPELDSS